MARQEKYFLGPNLLGDIRRTVTRVDSLSEGGSGAGQEPRLQGLHRRGGSGGGSSLRLGRVTAAWNKATLSDVVVYDKGTALDEEFAAPPLIVPDCVNKFANVEAGAWVLIGSAHGRWYLVTAECEVEPPPEEPPP